MASLLEGQLRVRADPKTGLGLLGCRGKLF